MKKPVLAASFTLLLAGLPLSGAWAYCSEPSMWGSKPSAPYGKPTAPYCLSGYSYSGKHSCDQYEIDRYISEINSYIRELNNYAEEARSFAESAISFANSAIDYADCEAEDAKSGLR